MDLCRVVPAAPDAKKETASGDVKEVGGRKPLIEVSFKGEVKRFSAEEISSMILTSMKKTVSGISSSPLNVCISRQRTILGKQFHLLLSPCLPVSRFSLRQLKCLCLIADFNDAQRQVC